MEDPRQDARVFDSVPAVESEKAAEVDPERAETDRGEGKDPAGNRAAPLPDNRLDQVAQVDVARVHIAHDDEHDAEERRGEQREDGRESSAR